MNHCEGIQSVSRQSVSHQLSVKLITDTLTSCSLTD